MPWFTPHLNPDRGVLSGLICITEKLQALSSISCIHTMQYHTTRCKVVDSENPQPLAAWST